MSVLRVFPFAFLLRVALSLSPLPMLRATAQPSRPHNARLCRKFAVFLRRFPSIRTDVVGLLDEWAARFFEELDYVREGNNGILFAKQMAKDLPQVLPFHLTYHFLAAKDNVSFSAIQVAL